MKEHPLTLDPNTNLANMDHPLVLGQNMRWHVLLRLINENNYKKVVEVGCAEGRTAWFLLENTNDAELFVTCVDPYEAGWAYCEDIARKYLDNFVEDAVCEFVKEPSIVASMLFKDESVDLVFIDADHSYVHVRQDIDAWWPKVRPGGLLVGHDWGDHEPGVQAAVLETFDMDQVAFSTNYVWYVKK